jgi:GNAT superfamily N-acetyltransferase
VTTLDLAGQPAAAHAAAAEPAAAPAAVTIRRAAQNDRAALAEMFARCTALTRYRRFHGHVNVMPARYLEEALSGGTHHLGLVAAVGGGGPGDGRVVALASCAAVAPSVVDVGVLVEDGWQRLGIGAALLREIAGHARENDIGMLTAQVLAEQSWILRLLAAYGTCESTISQGVLDATVKLSIPPAVRTR